MLVDVLLPTTCPVCGERGSAPCERCWRLLRAAPPAPPPTGVDVCRSLLLYEGAGRELVARLKYRNARSSIAWFSAGMAELARPFVTVGETVVTWAPTTAPRRRARGFDQAELLARGVARALQLPCASLLVRPPGVAQTGRRAAERRHGVRFDARAGVAATSVLIVDDVITTGATIEAAATALRGASSTSVIVVTAGRTPLKIGDSSADA